MVGYTLTGERACHPFTATAYRKQVGWRVVLADRLTLNRTSTAMLAPITSPAPYLFSRWNMISVFPLAAGYSPNKRKYKHLCGEIGSSLKLLIMCSWGHLLESLWWATALYNLTEWRALGNDARSSHFPYPSTPISQQARMRVNSPPPSPLKSRTWIFPVL